MVSFAAAGGWRRDRRAQGAIGTLPELRDTNGVLQGLTIRVMDPSQLKQMMTFLQDTFDMDVLGGTPD